MALALAGVCLGVGFVARAGELGLAAQPGLVGDVDRASPRFAAAAALRWGSRVAGLDRVTVIAPVVVIVPDVASYVDAIGQWSLVVKLGEAGERWGEVESDGEPDTLYRMAGGHGVGRFPVLIDDGSWRAREDIARFVRAFKPESVLRWSAAGARWPKESEADLRRRRILVSASRPWGATGPDALPAAWAKQGHVPTGVVATNEHDRAWPAALAIAAFRGLPIVWAPTTGRVDQAMPVDEALALDEVIRAGVERWGFAHRELGDAIESVTLCLNTSSSVSLGAGDPRGVLALTDVVGRLGGGVSFAGPAHERASAGAVRRWAWAGQIFGDEARSAYIAMCGLFLDKPDSAWLFDGYEDATPWNSYDMSVAAIALEQAGVSTMLDDFGRQSLNDWRRRASGPGRVERREGAAGQGDSGDEADAPGLSGGFGLDAGLVLVNSSGMQRWFDLRPGRGVSCDAPLLVRPLAVHMVHSWSANIPGARQSVGGRWLDRGAFVYVGSVHEPFLSAFMPARALVDRLVAGMPIGAAARWDGALAWKIGVFGDPSWRAHGPVPARGSGPSADEREAGRGPLALREGESGADIVRRSALAKAYPEVLTWLCLTGRDDMAARVALALVQDEPASFDARAAEASIGPAFRTGDAALLRAARDVLPPGPVMDELRDMAWHLLFPRLDRLSPEEAELLAMCVRAENAERDALEAMGALRSAAGRDRATEVMLREAERAPSNASRAAMLEAARAR